MNDPHEDAEFVAGLVARLTLDEKAALTAGVDMWTTCPIDRLGIPSVTLTGGPSGARGRYWGPAGTHAMAFPTGSALGATWDRDLLRQVGVELGRETRARAAGVLLGPTVNPQRAPLAGRTFECFSEDPLLSGVLGAEYVRGVQAEGVAATVKHLAGNEAEWQRNSVDTIIDERTMREVYLLPFEHCVRAGALAVMTSYNPLNGDHCPNLSWLLTDILRAEWGFDGIVVTDWWGLLDTAAAAAAGLDLEMPGPARGFGPHLADSVRDGRVPESTLNAIVTRLLGVFRRLGAWHADPDDREHARHDSASTRLARRASAASMVLIKNEHDVLPLTLTKGQRVAVIGLNANSANIMGGGSSQVRAQHRTTPLAALRERWGGDVEVVFEQGCSTPQQPTPLEPWDLSRPDGTPGLLVEYFDNPQFAGTPIVTQHGDDFRLQYKGPPGNEISSPDFAVRASATFTASTPGP